MILFLKYTINMNILLTLNKNYLPYLISLIRSINDYNDNSINFYIFSNDITLNDINKYQHYLSSQNQFHIIKIDEKSLEKAPTSKRYPLNMYHRIFAAKYLPHNIDKILYLDPDIIVKGDLSSIYNIDLEDNYFAAATNIDKFLEKFNQIKNGTTKNARYINTGVLLMNIKKLRKEQNEDDVYNFINKKKNLLMLPDQDVIHALYGEKIIIIDRYKYNLSDRAIKQYNLLKTKKDKITLEWVEKNTIIIHYLGKNKPWKNDYHGILKHYYTKYAVGENND